MLHSHDFCTKSLVGIPTIGCHSNVYRGRSSLPLESIHISIKFYTVTLLDMPTSSQTCWKNLKLRLDHLVKFGAGLKLRFLHVVLIVVILYKKTVEVVAQWSTTDNERLCSQIPG